MQSIQKINVDISRDRNLSEPSVYAKQNDSNSRKVEVTLFDSGVQLSSLTAAGKVFFGKGNNSYFEKIEITNGVTEFIIPQNALSSSGRIQAEILILNDTDTETLTSATFIINCHAQINPSGAITGENNGDILGQILERVEQIQASNMPRIPLPDGAIDLNELTSSAWWYTENQRIAVTNIPSNISEFDLIVVKEQISIAQILIAPTIDSSGIYFRFTNNAGMNWTDWQKIATDADVSTTTNLVNGSTAGSLRGINTKEEREEGDFFTPSYKMGESAVATGYNTAARGVYSHAEGDSTNANGRSSHAEGQDTTASGNYSHAEGISTTAGEGSHAEGHSTTASGEMSHAEGFLTVSRGKWSHSEGNRAFSSGDISHAEGYETTSSGYCSHVEGDKTIAGSYCQHAQGKYNIADNDNKYLHIVGNGSSDENRSNAHTLDWDGNAWFAGDVYVGGTSQDDENATKLSSVATDITQVKEKLDGIEEGANKTIVDTALSMTSTNPIQNKAVTERIKNHASFRFTSTTANVEYIKLGKFKGDGNGGRAIITINGKQGWNEKNDGGLKILTLSSNFCGDSTSNDIYTGGTFYTFGHSDDTADSIVEGITTDIVLVRAIGYSVKEVDVYIKIIATKHISYFVTIDYSEGCSWTTSTQEITSSETSPTEGATSHFTVPKKHIADSNNLKELKTPKGAATSTSYTAPYCQSGITVSDLTELKDYRTTIGVVYDGSNNTHSTISVRHRNGASNGTSFGMYITAPLKIESNLKWRNQVNGNWGTEKTLLDSSNFTNYIPYETGTCTLTASNGTVSNATYSVVGNMVTLNFNIAPTGAGNVVVSGLPFTATKNQSGFASSTATYNITANQTSVSINSTSGTAEYCTVTYLK